MYPKPELPDPMVLREVRRSLRKMENLCAKSMRQAQKITMQDVISKSDRLEFEDAMIDFQSEMKNLAADAFCSTMGHISFLCRHSEKSMLQNLLLVSEFDISLDDLKEKDDDS